MGAAIRAARAALRSSPIRRCLLVYALFAMAEKSVWGATLVFAYRHDGAREAGLVAVVILIPALLFAPFGASRADRSRPERIMRLSLAGQAAALVAAGIAMGVGCAAWGVYALVAVMPTLGTVMRPSVTSALPSHCRSAGELAAAEAMVSWIRPGAVLVAGFWLSAWLAWARPPPWSPVVDSWYSAH